MCVHPLLWTGHRSDMAVFFSGFSNTALQSKQVVEQAEAAYHGAGTESGHAAQQASANSAPGGAAKKHEISAAGSDTQHARQIQKHAAEYSSHHFDR